MSISAWNEGSDMTIFDIFRDEGFINEIDIPEEFHGNTSYDFSEDELFQQLCRSKLQLPEISFWNFLNVDSNICTEEISDGIVITNFINENPIGLSD